MLWKSSHEGNRPLRIGLFTDTFLPDQNGIVTSICLLSEELRKMGHVVDVVAPQFPEHLDVASGEKGGIKRIASVSYPFLPTYRLAWPTRRLFEEQYDLVHTHTPLTLGAAGARLARKWQVPHISTYHTHITAYTHYVPGLDILDHYTKVVPKLYGRLYGHADAVITPSMEMLDVLQLFGVRQPILIPTSINPAILQDAPPIESPWPAGKRRLLTLGRLAREKRFDLVLETLAQLPDAHLVILGEGPERIHLEELSVKLQIADRVTFVGVRPWTEVGAYYRLADLFLFASDTETQGLVLQEAQLMGVPVVAVGARGTLDGVLNDYSGYLVPVGDVPALVKHSRAILSDTALHNRLATGAREFSSRTTPSEIAKKVMNVYEKVLYR